MDSIVVSSFEVLLLSFLPCFTRPSQMSFLTLASGWVLANGPRTVTNLIRAAGSAAIKSHDAYQYFFSKGRWEMDRLWEVLFRLIVSTLATDGVIRLAGDDTLLGHCGRRIFGVGVFRDAVRSLPGRVAYGWGHNWVLLCIVVRVPLTETCLALPIMARLRQKAKKGRRKKDENETDRTTTELMMEMLNIVAAWAPDRRFLLLTDGAYACLAGGLPGSMKLISRLRRDAELYGPKPPRTGKRGRPRKRGNRLPNPAGVAADATTKWERVELTLYGKPVVRLLHSFDALWYHVCPDALIRVVIVRDPDGNDPDQFLFTTDLSMSATEVVLNYEARWSIEVAIRESKQSMGVQGPQARVEKAVRRQAPFGWLLQSLVKLWYVNQGALMQDLHEQPAPWYNHKVGVSYADMLSVLRRASWTGRIIDNSASSAESKEILASLIACAARAA